jgi:glycosyltransferase involved in cell wall biosynthesis
MKIAEIGAKKIGSHEGGIDVVVTRLSSYFALLGNKVVCFVSRKGTKLDRNTSNLCVKKVPTLHKKATEAIIYSFFATIKAKFGRFSVIHFHGEGNCLFLGLLKRSKSKIVVTVHGLDWKRGKFAGLGSKMLLCSEKKIAKYSDQLITLTKSDHDYFLEKYGKESTIIPNGFVWYPDAAPDLISEKFHLLGDDYFLFLARIVPEKGLHHLIVAYKEAKPFLNNKKLVIAGSGSYTDEYYQTIINLAGEDKDIIFVGFADGELREELFSNAFSYVLPSDIEGMPLSLLEALGHHRICIVSDIPENHVDETNCLFFKTNDEKSLSEKMVALCNITKKFQIPQHKPLSWEEVCDKTRSIYLL